MNKSFLGYGWVIDRKEVPEENQIMYMECDNDKLFCGFILAECDDNNSVKFVPSEMMKQIEDTHMKMYKLYKEISGEVAGSQPSLVLINKEV